MYQAFSGRLLSVAEGVVLHRAGRGLGAAPKGPRVRLGVLNGRGHTVLQISTSRYSTGCKARRSVKLKLDPATALGVALLAGGPISPAHAQPGNFGTAVPILSELSQPVTMVPVPEDDKRLLVLERTGVVKLVTYVPAAGGVGTYSVRPAPVLDAVSITRSDGNRGMLGVTLAPDFATSRQMYVFHNTQIAGFGDVTAVARYTIGPDWTALPASRQVIWQTPAGQYHHGGTIRFGPDNMLYIAKGDEGDFYIRARNIASPYGKVFRVDPTRDDFPADPLKNFGIPPDNPYAGQPGVLPEVWLIGLRSPWGNSFDRFTGDFWIADVGEIDWEEITHIPAARLAGVKDLGWPNYEGSRRGPFGIIQPDPPVTSLIMPIYDYPHAQQPGYEPWQVGCSVGGGVVYRGSDIRPWRGRYFFVDLCNGRVKSLVVGPDGQMQDLQDMTPALRDLGTPSQRPPFVNLVGIVEDHAGEMLVIDIIGRVYKIVPETFQPPLADVSGPGGHGPDGEFTADDLLSFVAWFVSNDPRADCASPGQAPIVDQQLTADDIARFVTAFIQAR
jgi:hypothetical protein